MKKFITVLLGMTLCLSSFTACGKDSDDDDKKTTTKTTTTQSKSDDETKEETKTTAKKTTTAEPTTTTTTTTACAHDWADASCKAPKTCNKCGETEGETLPHTWRDATCSAPKTCEVCGKTEGDTLPHTWIDATYDAPQTCSVCGATVGAPLERPPIEIQIVTPIPFEFNTYDFRDNIRDTVLITDVTYDVEESYLYPGEYELTLYFTGEKTYDVNGSGQGRSAKVSIKVKDEEGYVVADDTFYSPSVAMGEKFRNEKCSMWTNRLPAGKYYIELLNTN